MECQRCQTKAGLYKEILEDNTFTVTCGVCGWHTGKLPRDNHEAKTRDIPDKHEYIKRARDFNDV